MLRLVNSNFYKGKIIYFFMENKDYIGNYFGVDFYANLEGTGKDRGSSSLTFEDYTIGFSEETGKVYNLEKMIERKYVYALRCIALSQKKDLGEDVLSIDTHSLEKVKKLVVSSVSYPKTDLVMPLSLEDIKDGYESAEVKFSLPYAVQTERNFGEEYTKRIEDFLNGKKD